MNRRDFVPIASAAMWAETLAGQLAQEPSRPGDWVPRLAEGLRSIDDATLRWIAQMGLEWVTLGATESIRADGKRHWSKWAIEELQERLDTFGLRLHSLKLPTRWLHGRRLGNDGRDRAIENACESLVAAGEVAVSVVEWPWAAEARWGSDTSWAMVLDRLAYFAERVMPVAEQANIKMALSPNDPFPRGHPGHRPVFAALSEVERFFETVPSPANGITMSHRTIPGMNIDIVGAIRRIGRLGRIHHVEFDSPAVFPAMGRDENYPDGFEVMQAYRESGYVLGMVSDHASALPEELRGGKIGSSYSHGYLRGLVEAVNA